MLSRSSSAYQPLGGASDTNRQRHDHTEVRSYIGPDCLSL